MRFFSGDPRTTTIQWSFTDLPYIDTPTVFYSQNWTTDGQRVTELGEVDGAARVWCNGQRVSSAAGKHFCGTHDQWMYGDVLPPDHPVPLLPDGTPVCCLDGVDPSRIVWGSGGQIQGYNPSAIGGSGGQRQGGRGVWPKVTHGGQIQGGHGTFGTVGHGGQVQGGNGLFVEVATRGGQREGGSGSFSDVSSGGQRQGGKGLFVNLEAGGQRQGGSGLAVDTAHGGQLQGGSSSVRVVLAHGGQLQGGHGLAVDLANGGQLQGKAGRFVMVSSGGSRQGGSGDFTQMNPVLSNYTGSTTSAYVAVFDYSNSGGVNGSMMLKNTHATLSLTFRTTVTDMFGTVTVSGDTVLAPGSKFSDNYETATLACPIKEFKLEVKDTIPGMHSTYSAYDSHVT